jgi:MFS family permease
MCGVSVSMDMLIVGRVLQGLGGGGVSNLVTICICDTFSMRYDGPGVGILMIDASANNIIRQRPAYFGIVALTWMFASAVGPLLGGIISSKASWKWCFFINRKFAALKETNFSMRLTMMVW